LGYNSLTYTRPSKENEGANVWVKITEAIVNNELEFRVYYDGEILERFKEYKEAREFYNWIINQPSDTLDMDFEDEDIDF